MSLLVLFFACGMATTGEDAAPFEIIHQQDEVKAAPEPVAAVPQAAVAEAEAAPADEKEAEVLAEEPGKTEHRGPHVSVPVDRSSKGTTWDGIKGGSNSRIHAKKNGRGRPSPIPVRKVSREEELKEN